MGKSASSILAAADPRGNVEAVRQLATEAGKVGSAAIALLGNLKQKNASAREYAEILKAVAEPKLPIFYIPGPEDVPHIEFLREVANLEIVYPKVRGVHGTFALETGHYVWSGMGGIIEDDRDRAGDEIETRRYPGWEVEYRLKFLHELKDYMKVFLFTTAPEHKGLGQQGSRAVAEIIKTYSPRIALICGERREVMIGTSLVVALGSLSEGDYASIDVRTKAVTFGSLNQSAKAA